MMTDWRPIKLEEVCDRITVGHVGSMAEEYQESGIPFLRSKNIEPFRLNYRDLKFIDRKFHERLKKSALKPGDVAVVRTGYPGTACVIPKDLGEANCSDLVLITPGAELNTHFLAAMFNSAFGRTLVGGNLVGAAQQHFNVTTAKQLKLTIPPKPVQDKIGAVLLTYQDLIETNKRRIALLEEMAEELYREWFVRMRFPGHEDTKFVKGVPEGWETKLLPELVKISYGFPFQSPRFNTSGLGKPIVRIRNIPKSSTEDYTDERADDKYLVETGDLLVGMDGEFHMNHWYGEQAYLVQRVCRIKGKDPKLAGYLALAIRAPIKHFEGILACSGATVGHLGAKHLGSIKILIPPGEMNGNLEMLNQLFDQKLKLSLANRNLTQTRDLLLPRLISGKLAVEDLEIEFPPSMREEANAPEPAYA
jgi:type I restriction enzyme, S subunit